MIASLEEDEAAEEGAEAAAEGRTAILYLELSMSETLATRLRKKRKEDQHSYERKGRESEAALT